MKRLLIFSCAILAGCIPTQKEYTVIRETSRPAMATEEKTTLSTQNIQPDTDVPGTPPDKVIIQQVPASSVASVSAQTEPIQTAKPICQTTQSICPAGMVQAQGYTAGYNTTYSGGQMQTAMSATSVQAAPIYYAGTYTAGQPTIQYVVEQPMVYSGGYMQVPAGSGTGYESAQMMVQDSQMAVMNTNGTTSGYVTYSPAVQPAPNGSIHSNGQTSLNQPLAPTVQGDSLSLIILQHPVHRDLVKCNFNDADCLAAYQAQGYVQLRNSPHFAGYKAVPSESDYPTRRWRDNNNIPRW